jgi:hypothetical protein
MLQPHNQPRLKPENWLREFMPALIEFEKESFSRTSSEWTQFMGKVLDRVARKTKCYAAMRRIRPKRDEYSGEYLNIDAIFFDESAYDNWENDDWDPPILPSAAIELENDYDPKKITYCLWKLLCIRAHLRILIGYQRQLDRIESLKAHLEKVISENRLMEGDPGSLLVIIGDDSLPNESEWKEYFNIFQWNDDGLTRVPISILS